MAIDFATIHSALRASDSSPWQTRLYAVSRWTGVADVGSTSPLSFWGDVADHIASYYPSDAPFDASILIARINEADGLTTRVPSSSRTPEELAPADVMAADLSAHIWSSIVAAFALMPSPEMAFIPGPPTVEELEHRFRRSRNFPEEMSKADVEALSISVLRQLVVVVERVRASVTEVLDDLRAGDELTSLLTVESALHAYGFPGTAISLDAEGRLVVVVEWARASDLVPRHEVTRSRRTLEVRERDPGERADELARQLVRYLTAVARVALTVVQAASSVEVLAVEPNSIPGDPPIVATLAFDRAPHDRLNSTSASWMADWIAVVDAYHDTGLIKTKSLDRFVKSHGERLRSADRDLMTDIGPRVTVGSRSEEGDLLPFAVLSEVVGGPVGLQLGDATGSARPASLFGVLFWLDVRRRRRQAREEDKRAAAQRQVATAASGQQRPASRMPSAPQTRPRISTRPPRPTEPRLPDSN